MRWTTCGARSTTAHPDAPSLTLLPFLVRAIVLAVADQPHLNATFDDEAELLTVHGPVHVGIATQTPNGLLVPVVRDADTLDLWRTAAEIARVSEAARTGKATRDELGGSTITITSLGALGGLVTTPIINHPEVAIVGVNKMQVRPMWDGQQFQPRTMMNLSSSFDHRIVDGWDAATFVQRLKALLETPALLFIGEPGTPSTPGRRDAGMSDGADCDVLIVGAGPGGYVCALRAAQLGLKVVIVERAEIGGTCLNIGCIPSKAIIHAADEYAAAGGREHLGITTDAARIDLAVTMGWKDGVVHRLTGGVATLLDHGGVRRIAGEAQIVDGKTVRVGDEMITTDHLVLATGSEPIALAAPAVRRTGAVVHRCAGAHRGARPARRRRRRLHRPRARDRLPQARRRGDRGRAAVAHPAAVRRGAHPPGVGPAQGARRHRPPRGDGRRPRREDATATVAG